MLRQEILKIKMGNTPFGNDLIGHIVYRIILGTLEIFILFMLWLQLTAESIGCAVHLDLSK